MKILLLSPPYLTDYMRNARCDFVSLSHTQWYPIWLGYCGAFLEKHNHKIKLMDAPAENLNHAEAENEIMGFSPDIIVVYSSTMSEDNDIEFTDKISQKLNCKSVYVGPYVSIHPEEYIKKSKTTKLAIKGEFEYPVLEIIEGKKNADIKNLVWEDNGKIIINEERPLLTTNELDSIPFVTDFFSRHLNIKKYKAVSEYYPFIDLMTGRGCKWGRCTYCLWVHSFIKGPVYNKRSIENVTEEIKFIKKQLGYIRSVMIQDDTLPADRAREISESILTNDIKIVWSCYARGELDYETLKLMKKSGCRNLHVGYESADSTVLKNIKKGITADRMTKFTEEAKRAGLRIHGDFALGFNGETVESIKKTIAWAKKMDPHTAQFQIMIPYQSTVFYDCLKNSNWLKNGRPDYPDLSYEELFKWSQKAYREFYISWQYLRKVIRHPYEHIFSRLDTLVKAIPSIFWKKPE